MFDSGGAKKVIALERDKRCIPALMDIADYYDGKLEILERDSINFDLNEIKDLGSLKVVANLPYNIGTELLVRWLNTNNLASKMGGHDTNVSKRSCRSNSSNTWHKSIW